MAGPEQRPEETTYGWSPEVQRKVVVLPLADRGAFGQLGPKVFDARWISYAPLKPIARVVYRACAENGGDPPSLELLDELVAEAAARHKPAVADAVRKEWALVRATQLPDARLIRAKAAEWAQAEACAQVVLKASELVEAGALGNGGGAKLVRMFQDALAVGQASEACIRVVREADAVAEELAVQEAKVPTGFERVDRALGGGAAPGLYLVAGAPKIGKTAFLTQLDAAACRHGLTVWHISGEMRMRPMLRRTLSAMTGYGKRAIQADPRRAVDVLSRAYSQTGGEVILEYAPGFTVEWMAGRLRQLEAQGERVDLIVADFIDVMRGQSYSERRWELEDIGKRLRDLSVESGIPVWSAKALNRAAVTKEVPTEADLAECFGLVYVVDALFVLCCTREEQQRVVTRNGVTYPGPIIRLFYAVGREEEDRYLVGAWTRNNDRQRWQFLPGYLPERGGVEGE
jgi:hypothetical protein